MSTRQEVFYVPENKMVLDGFGRFIETCETADEFVEKYGDREYSIFVGLDLGSDPETPDNGRYRLKHR